MKPWAILFFALSGLGAQRSHMPLPVLIVTRQKIALTLLDSGRAAIHTNYTYNDKANKWFRVYVFFKDDFTVAF